MFSHPKTYLVPQRQKVEPASPNPVKWFKQVISFKDEEFIEKCGIDAFLFVRYLWMLVKIFFPAMVLILPVLFPLNRIDGLNDAGHVQGLEQLGWLNITLDHQDHFWGHLVMVRPSPEPR